MRPRFLRWRWKAPVLVAVCLGVVIAAASSRDPKPPVAAPAYELVTLPTGLDSLSTLEDAASHFASCDAPCTEIVYVWSPRMPLSRSAIPNIHRAASELGAGLTLVGFEELERFAETGGGEATGPETMGREPTGRETAGDARVLAEALLEAGALTHAPALVVHDGTRSIGSAILGYKTAAAYEWLIGRRLREGAREDVDLGRMESPLALPPDGATARLAITDFPVIGVPGAYFRWVPGRDAIAYESDRRVYLLDLESGQNLVAPGTIDFVPTPDGRYFVTPGPRRVGLAFYDADQVFAAARTGNGANVAPIATDGGMRDQYPSVGVLAEDEESVSYRILTSWFEGLRYRDYRITHPTADGPATVEALGPSIVPCAGMELSTPIMSQDGQEVAARDEESGTTKIYRILPEGRCEVVLPLGMPTRKVAWHASGRKLAFSTPRVRSDGSGGADPGIFVYDRDERRVTRVADSRDASQLAFPDFVGDEAIVFMIPERDESRFRLVSPIP